MPPTIHVTQYNTSALETNKTESRSYFIIPCKIIQGARVLETLYFPENKKNLDTAQSVASVTLSRRQRGSAGGGVAVRANVAKRGRRSTFSTPEGVRRG